MRVGFAAVALTALTSIQPPATGAPGFVTNDAAELDAIEATSFQPGTPCPTPIIR